jgi:hypothetical protein
MNPDTHTTTEDDSDQSTKGYIHTPRWAIGPIEDLLDDQIERHDILQMCIGGIRASVAAREYRIKYPDPKAAARTAVEIGRIEGVDRLARREIDDDFPALRSNFVTSLWSSLEAAVRLFVARWLEKAPGALEVDAIYKLKITLGDYNSLEGEDRFFYILELLEQSVSPKLKRGIGRFEEILRPFGLSGPVDDTTRRDLLELSQMRHVLMHRGGRADRRLLDVCPLAAFLGWRPCGHYRTDNRTLFSLFHALHVYSHSPRRRAFWRRYDFGP